MNRKLIDFTEVLLNKDELRLIALLCSSRLEVLGGIFDSSDDFKNEIYNLYNSLYSKVCNALTELSHGDKNL